MGEVKDRRLCIYPDYINSAKTVAQGRRLPADKCVDWPTLPEMLDVCIRALHLPADIEGKRYPRNWCVELGHEQCFGRLRVLIKKEDGSPINPDVTSRRELLLKLGEFVAKHPNRHKKPGGKADAGGSSSSSSGGAGGSSKASGKKGGKKKK